MSPPKFNVLTATATSLQQHLSARTLSSVDLVETYLAQIEAHNRQGLELRAVAAVAPREIVLERARELDGERARGEVRGALHGIPVIVKDVIVTGPELGMPTTAGAVAFEEAVAKKSAGVVEQLLSAGMIVLGKASLTEFCGSRASAITAGYSASNGQTQSAYIKGGRKEGDGIAGHTSPGGSSSGSAAGVAAGFAPVSVATETTGSLVLPANRGGLYAIRLTHGSTPVDGMFRLARGWDTIGPMAKCTEDLAPMIEALLSAEARKELPEKGLKSVMNGKMDGLKLGALAFDEWQPLGGAWTSEEEMEQMRDEYEAAIKKLKEIGMDVTHPVDLALKKGVSHDDKTVKDVSDNEMKDLMVDFTSCFETSPVRTLDELIEFNKANAERAMPEPHPDQKELLICKESSMTPEQTAELAAQLRAKGRAALDEVFEKVDIIVAPSDCKLASNISAAGYTTGVVPLGYLRSTGQPQGLTVAAKAYQEAKLLQFMSAYEANFPKRKTPALLQ